MVELNNLPAQGTEAVSKELTQFHTLRCFRPKDPSTLSCEDHRNALTSLMFLTENRTGEVKAQACANGSTQRTQVAKEEPLPQLSHRSPSLSRVQSLHMKKETWPHVTFPGIFFKPTTQTLSSCDWMAYMRNLWYELLHQSTANTSQITKMANQFSMSNW